MRGSRSALSAPGAVPTMRSCYHSNSRIQRQSRLRELIAMVALLIGLLFALSFVCVALIATLLERLTSWTSFGA